jgi:hypothetical protein
VPSANYAQVSSLSDGDQIIIVNPAYKKALSTVKTGFYNIGVNYATNDFANVTNAEIFVVTANDDGTYTFTSLTGDVIALAASYSSLNVDGEHKTWKLEAKGDGIFYVKNAGRGTYLEWYASKNNWSTYSNANSDLFEISFYAQGGADTPVEPPHEHSYVPVVTDPTCTEDGYTTHTCECGDSYTDTVVPATGHNYVDGTCTACGDTEEVVGPETPVAGGSADFNTIVLPSSKPNGDSSYTATYTTAAGWVSANSAIQCGGSAVNNPQFPVIGSDNTYKAICMNGKTSAPGKLTSPTLTGGISKLTINYTKMFTDTVLGATITITDLATGTVYTNTLSKEADKNDKYTVWTFEWVLETPITGDFTIEILNNCPSGQDGNKDRLTILSLTWEGAASGGTDEPACEHEWADATCAAPKTCTKCGATEGETLAHTFADATCTAPKTCTVCQATEGEALGHNFANGVCTVCGAADPDYVNPETCEHVWADATCSTPKTCTKCKTTEGEPAPHVDTDLDITCDYEGCTKRIISAADSKVSLFTANHMIIVSLSGNYYMEGVVTEVTDAKNGVFVITDEAGDTILVRLPKDANGLTHANWEQKIVVGDTVRLYGKPTRNTSSTSTQQAKVEGAILTILESHDHVFGEATCLENGVCFCGKVGIPALGHTDEDASGLCDRCDWNMNLKVETVVTRTDNGSAVLNDAKTTSTWNGTEFSVTVDKSTGTMLYTTSKDHMRFYKQNELVIASLNGKAMNTVTITFTAASHMTNFEKLLTGFTFTKDEGKFTITIEHNSAEDLLIKNSGTSTIQFKAFDIVYE